MDKRSWPWKKKSSEKGVTTTDLVSVPLSTSADNQSDQDNNKGVSYVQISAESYAHLVDLEGEVKDLNKKLASVHESLSSAQSEITAKDILVKQHAKVAEEAVSGWEKAEAEAMALKQQLEAVTLLRLTAEERASHFDGALKECMKQIRNVKEESEQKLQDVVFAKTQQWDKIKVELEAKLADFEQELLRASGENAAISRSLQERSHMLMKISEEKSQADAEIEMLKNNIQSCEKDINSWKYELHILSKELEIRNEEKNMSMRSAEVANKQRLEDVKKITKLEAECQRLRALVRKKLPGPAALAQMKVEVESLGRDYGDNRIRRSSPARGSSPRVSVSDFAFESTQQCHKENEFLTERLFAMEEETKMLKEALSKRNSELQASRNLCAKTANKLHSLEAHVLAFNQQKSPSKPSINIPFENGSTPPSLTSMSEDGIDEEASCSESWATTLIVSELSQLKKDKDVDKGSKADNMELMDDFLEMERLACQSTESNGNITLPNGLQDRTKTKNDDATSSADISTDKGVKEQLSDLEPPKNQDSCNEELSNRDDDVPVLKLRSRIASMFESQSLNSDITTVLDHIRCILQDTQEQLPRHSVSCIVEQTPPISTSERIHHGEATRDITNNVNSLDHGTDTSLFLEGELKNAISQIHDSIVSLGKEAIEIQGLSSVDHSLSKKIDEFSSSVNKVLCTEVGLNDFILGLSRVLSESTDLSSIMFRGKLKEGDSNSSECIDKVTLLENKIDRHEPTKDRFSLACSAPDLDIIEGAIPPDFEMRTASQKCSLEEFEQLKMEKENMQMDLARYTETLEETNRKLVETDEHLAELKSQLAASEKSNSLAETQLKCMAESYKSLESRTRELEVHAQELESEINLLRTKAETLDSELREERQCHEVDLAKYNELLEQIERNEKSSMCSFPTDVDVKTNQEKEIAAAAEKLAECQQTIYLLGRQLKALGPSEIHNSHQMSDNVVYEPSSRDFSLPGVNGQLNPDDAESENVAGDESPVHGYNLHLSPTNPEADRHPRSPMNSKRQKQRSSSGSSTSSSEKHGRGFSRFFSKPRKDDN